MCCGDGDIERAVVDLAQALPELLRPLARIAYDYPLGVVGRLRCHVAGPGPRSLGAHRRQPPGTR